MKKKGFTLIELLVVIAIIAMLLAILMPALNKVKRLAQRLVCGTSVKGLGTAMMVYAQDFDDEYPIQGGNGDHRWSWNGLTWDWADIDKNWNDPTDRSITVSASLYLLVRIADVDPKSFVCRSGDETPFKGLDPNPENIDLVELWDFGGRQDARWGHIDDWPAHHVSYAYHLPYDAAPDDDWVTARPVSATASASTAVLADKNPWCDSKLTDGTDTKYTLNDKKRDYMMLVDWLGAGEMDWDDPGDPIRNSTTAWQVQIANSQPHGREGQNVLYGDGHASFEKRPDIGYQNDNIYTQFAGWSPYTEGAKRTGAQRTSATGAVDVIPGNATFPKTDEDSVLVNDDSRIDIHNIP